MLRRRLALATAAALLAVPALSSCGFNYATDRPYTPANGANNHDADVDVLSAVIVSGQEGAGTFVASFVNPTDTAIEFTSLDPDLSQRFSAPEVTPVAVPPQGLVNLAIDGGVPIQGDFAAGNYVPLVVGFSDGTKSVLQVPVVPDDGDFAGLDISAEASPQPSPSS